MKNDTRSRNNIKYDAVFMRRSIFIFISANLALSPILAYADVPPPPPSKPPVTINSSFPSGSALERQGYDPKTGILKVQTNNTGKPNITSNGTEITGKQTKNITVTGKYGEKIKTKTNIIQKASVSKLQTAANIAIIGSVANDAASSSQEYANRVGQDLANGNYGSALHNVIMTGGAIIDGFTGGTIRSIAEGYKNQTASNTNNLASSTHESLRKIANDTKNNQIKFENNGNLKGALANATANKAANELARTAETEIENKKQEEEAKKQGLKKYQLIVNVDGSYSNYPFYSNSSIDFKGSMWNDNNSPHWYREYQSSVTIRLPKSAKPSEITISTPSDRFVYISYKSYPSGEEPPEHKNNNNSFNQANASLNKNDVSAILERMLKNQETNHEELMKQLSTLGDTVNNAITGTNYTTATGISDPFTPAGSNIPQQTKITIDNKGNITSSTIPRPDLSPNSTQAPTRSEIIKKNTETSTSENPSTTTGTTTGTQQGSSQQQQQNFCEQNPKSAACAELGNDDYEDLNIPEQAIDLKIEPLNTFQSTGVCPAPKQFDLGILGRFEIGYDALCDVASRLRPIFILITVVSCSFFVYGAIKEL